jgi:hypothetical protein
VTQPLGTDPSRRSRLLALKLTALVRDHCADGPEGSEPSAAGDAEVRPGVWPGGAALVRSGEAWVLAEDRPERALGPALAWARQQGTERLRLVASSATGVLARRAALFADPEPEVLHAVERILLPALVSPYDPEPAVPVSHEAFVPLIEAVGATVSREHGVLVGEIAGLEVCRAITDPATGVDRLEVGVGAHDREAFLLMHGEVPTEAALQRVVDAVRPHRLVGADPHPLNRLASERLLRSDLLARPGLVGAAVLRAASPPVPRANVKDPVPCVAIGEDEFGAPVVVVCSVGIDLDLVPFAADARSYLGLDEARLLLAVPGRDAVPVTRSLASRLRHPAEVVAIG